MRLTFYGLLLPLALACNETTPSGLAQQDDSLLNPIGEDPSLGDEGLASRQNTVGSGGAGAAGAPAGQAGTTGAVVVSADPDDSMTSAGGVAASMPEPPASNAGGGASADPVVDIGFDDDDTASAQTPNVDFADAGVAVPAETATDAADAAAPRDAGPTQDAAPARDARTVRDAGL